MKNLKAILTGLFSLISISTFAQSSSDTLSTTSVSAASTLTSSLTPADVHGLKNLSDEQLQAFVVSLNAAPLLTTNDLPHEGTWGFGYFSLQHPDWPALPGDVLGLPAWPMSEGYLLDDVDYDYDAAVPAKSGMRTMALDGPPTPPGEGGGTNALPNISFPGVDYGTNLWIAQVSLTNGYFAAIASNTIADVQYEIQSRSDLTDTNWISSGQFIFGSELTNWTALNPLPVNLTNNYFIRLRSWIDSDNVGIPDWWQLEYFGYIGIDPYADSPAGDGFDNFYKYQNGLAATDFASPPAPANLVAVLSTNGTDVMLSWNSAQGTATNYALIRWVWNPAIYDYDSTTINTGNTNAFLDADVFHSDDDWSDFYELTAQYPGGNVSETAFSYIYDIAPPPPTPPDPVYNIYASATLIRNATGRWQLMFSDISANISTIRLTWTDTDNNDTTQDILPGILTNGVYHISDEDIVSRLGDTISVQGIGADGEAGVVVQAGVVANDAPYFVDGRQHMKQNLVFLIRGAEPDLPYMGANYMVYPDGGYYNQVATNFEEFSFLRHGQFIHEEDLSYFQLNDLWPFEANYDLKNFLVNLTTYTNLYTAYDPQVYHFNFYLDFTTNIPAPPILSSGDPFLILQPEFDWPQYIGDREPYDLGVSIASYTTSVTLPASTHDVFGLFYETGYLLKVNFPLSSGQFEELVPGNTDSLTLSEQTNGWLWGGYMSQCAEPTLEFTNYFFNNLINPNGNNSDLPGAVDYSGHGIIQNPTPIADAFNVTNQTPPLIIGSVGQPMIIGGWAKFGIQESSPTKYAYLGQYFVTNAFLLDAEDNLTTNSAGILSPYGEFFPTQAGKAQLLTMPDIDPPYQQGTCSVTVVSLNVDANHDGNMDLSYFGQDQTSVSHPYVFWCNNNYDRLHTVDGSDSEQDDLPPQRTPDFNYLDSNGGRIIPCARDLEDYSRLWINGVTSNLLATLPPGSSVTLNWGDVDSPNASNPTIDLFQAADTDGGIGYLTNSTVAVQQIDNTQSWYIGRLAPGGSLQLNAIQFNDFWAGNHFIWCGVTNGSGKLNLTFKDAGGHTLGQASVYLQIKDIKQMYERWTIGDNPNYAPATTAKLAENDLTPPDKEYEYGPATTNTPYILFVHGWNMSIYDKDRYAETAYKRLYWQGYQGRFGSFRWPTGFGFSGIISALIDARNYDNSEYQAWLSGAGLLNKLTDLNAQYPGQVFLMAHSMGNVVAGEALRLASSQLVNTYIAMQGAVPAHCYDATTATRSIVPILGLGQDDGTPDRYADYYTNSAPSYFNSSTGAGTYVNFYNTNDYALSTKLWQFDQNLKPDNATTPAYHYVTPSGTHPSGFYRQSGSFETDLYFPTNTYELFAYGDEARCYALGAQADVGGAFTTARQIDLPSVWPIDTYSQIDNKPYSAHVWHSAQFRSDNMSRASFWHTILTRMNLSP